MMPWILFGAPTPTPDSRTAGRPRISVSGA